MKNINRDKAPHQRGKGRERERIRESQRKKKEKERERKKEMGRQQWRQVRREK